MAGQHREQRGRPVARNGVVIPGDPVEEAQPDGHVANPNPRHTPVSSVIPAPRNYLAQVMSYAKYRQGEKP